MAKRIKSPYKAWRRYREREQTCTTLRKVFEYATTKYADRTAYQYVDGGQKYTYEEFRRKTEQLSLRMTRFGIKHGDRVAIFSQNMPNWVVAFFSATAFGRVAVPILPDSSEVELTNILNHSESKVLFISQRMMPKLSEECRKKVSFIPMQDVPAGGKGTLGFQLDTQIMPEGECVIMISLVTNSPLRPVVNLFVAGIVK